MKSPHLPEIACVLTLILLPPSTTSAAEVFRGSGEVALATFVGTDPSGCVQSTVFIGAQKNATLDPPGGPTFTSVASATVLEYNQCTFDFFIRSGTVTDPDLRMNAALTQATLVARVPVCDSAGCVDLVVNVVWSATSDVNRNITNTHIMGPGSSLFHSYKGLSRDAQAIGDVSNGVSNLTPDPSVYASMGSAVDHVLVKD